MAAAELDVLVIGAGAAGLAAARTLEAAGREPLLVEAAPRAGGAMGTRAVEGYRIEEGPNSFLVRAPARRFLRRFGADALLEQASSASRKRMLFHAGRLQDVPSGPVALGRTPLLSGRAKLRALGEPFVARGDATGESVSEFVGRRLGREVSSALVGPFLTGVYAGDERELGAEAVFPSLVELERSHGSIVRGALSSAFRRPPAEERGLSGSHSARGGLGELAASLAGGLRALRLDTRVIGLRGESGTWIASLRGPDGEETLRARSVVVAVPAHAAAELLRPVASESAEALAAIHYAPIVAVGLGAAPGELRTSVEALGFLVPREAGLGLLGCLFMSELFAGRAPEGRVLLHCMVGGTRWPEAVELPDDELLKRTLEDLDRTLGLAAEPRCLTIVRWPRAVPQPGRDHPRLVARLRARLAGLGPIELAGGYLDGVSLADSFASGVAAAERLLARSG